MSLDDPTLPEDPERTAWRHKNRIEKEAFEQKIKEETGFDVHEIEGFGVESRTQFLEPELWPQYAEEFMNLVKSGLRGVKLEQAVFELEKKYPIWV